MAEISDPLDCQNSMHGWDDTSLVCTWSRVQKMLSVLSATKLEAFFVGDKTENIFVFVALRPLLGLTESSTKLEFCLVSLEKFRLPFLGLNETT